MHLFDWDDANEKMCLTTLSQLYFRQTSSDAFHTQPIRYIQTHRQAHPLTDWPVSIDPRATGAKRSFTLKGNVWCWTIPCCLESAFAGKKKMAWVVEGQWKYGKLCTCHHLSVKMHHQARQATMLVLSNIHLGKKNRSSLQDESLMPKIDRYTQFAATKMVQ